jgi:hypothetical protein
VAVYASQGRAAPPTARRRRRPGAWQAIVGVLLIIAVVLAVADRVAASLAANELESRIENELAARNVSYSSLDVSVGGTPFLTQVAEGRYESISIDMTQVQLPTSVGGVATMPELHAVANGVRVDTVELMQGGASVTAEQVAGAAVVSYATLSNVVDLSQYRLVNVVFSEREGALWATGALSVAGVEVPIEAEAVIGVAEGVIQVGLRNAKAIGVSMPGVGLDLMDQLVNTVIEARMPALPFGLALQSLSVTPDGLQVHIAGEDVPLAQ